MSNPFQTGDIVSIKSGGMPMTVVNFHEENQEVLVAYFDLDGNVMRDGFPPDALELTENRWKMNYCVNIDEFEDEDEDDY